MDEQHQPTQQDPLLNLLLNEGLQNALPRIAEILMCQRSVKVYHLRSN